MVKLAHLTPDDDSLQRAAIGESVAAKHPDRAGDVDGLQSRSGERIGLDGRDALGQHHRFEFRAFVEHLFAYLVGFRHEATCIGLAASHDANARPVELRHRARRDELTHVLNVRTVDDTRHLQFLIGARKQGGQRTGRLDVDFCYGPEAGRQQTTDNRQQ